MSWIKLTRQDVDCELSEITLNTDRIAYYAKNSTERFDGKGSVVVLQSNYAILVTETEAEIDEKIGVNLASLPPSNVFDPCI